MQKTLKHYLRFSARKKKAETCYKAFKSGDNDAFAEIYNHFREPIFQYVSARISSSQVAEDVTQEVFLKVYRFRENFDETHAFSTWLWTIARNTVFDSLRKTKGALEETGDVEELPCSLENAETLLQTRDLRRTMRALIRPLTKLQRRVLWMRVVQQLSYDEISKAMGLSLSAVKNLAHRARLTMAEAFDHGELAFV